MSKRTQTDKQLTRRQVARRERERRRQQILTTAAIVVGAIIVVILAYGGITEITKARRPVARVGEAAITSNAFRSRQTYERWMTELEIFQYQNYLSQLSTEPLETQTLDEEAPETEGPALPSETTDSNDLLVQQLQLTISQLEQQLSSDFANVYAGQVLDRMIEEELLRQEAEERGLSVTDDELQQQIEISLGYDRDAATASLTDTETLTDTAAAALTELDYDELYEQFEVNVLQITRYPEKDFREMMRAQVLRSKLQEALAADIDPVQDQVEATLFVVESVEQGEDLQARINEDGEDPAAIVEELNADESDTTAGYELPWLPLAYYSAQFSEDVVGAAFDTAVGQASEPAVDTDESIYVIYIQGHEERELSEDLLAQSEQQTYQTWLTEQKDAKVEYLDWEEAVVAE
ncbi:MAG: SurA N-terminal domain-containing protein [Anaerolineae bacterium]|nr:SurA N-terminal domain-containing protein [Anaerolineae bacterium]